MVFKTYNSKDLTRRKKLSEDSYRHPFRRDFARLIHSAAFRRLQGKTQLFPLGESDFFRNRMTHSLEVAQIAKSITLLINKKYIDPILEKENIKDKGHYYINCDLVEFAGLAHDLGHPPFGHQGEKALNQCMREFGGFESNAQNLRILSRLEKKEKRTEEGTGIEKGQDKRLGLNLTCRSLASILKYDRMIPQTSKRKDPLKGYYFTDKDLVDNIKKSIATVQKDSNYKTIECQIMDMADDIAYSTYDLEDAFKTKFLSPMKMLSADKKLLKHLAKKVNEKLHQRLSGEDITGILHDIFKGISGNFNIREYLNNVNKSEYDNIVSRLWGAQAFDASTKMCLSGYERTKFTSSLIDSAINNIEFEYNHKYPALSKIRLKEDARKTVEVLKQFVYESVVRQSRLQVVESRGQHFIKQIFEIIDDPKGEKFMPPDFQEVYNSFNKKDKINKMNRKRTICDFIASMTDRYAIEFYKRLFSPEAETIFKEL